MAETKYMKMAIRLALKGKGFVNPNPLVGAVLIKNGEIIGKGYHHKWGDFHAERDAINNCLKNGKKPEGSELYVTLEPCCHQGKQPPCTMAIVQYGIKKVYVGSSDPNPLVAGKGIEFLKNNGVEVEENILKKECDNINQIFFYYITHKKPFVALKFASTIDGKIATKTNDSKWITNPKSREFVHRLRGQYSAILVGSNTVRLDNPMLNCRLPNSHNPLRLILDSNLSINLESNIVKTAHQQKTLIAYLSDSQNHKQIIQEKGIQLYKAKKIRTNIFENGIDIDDLLKYLASINIDSVLVEGGGKVNFSFIKADLVNKVYAFTGNIITGGNAKSPVDGEGFSYIKDCPSFELKKIKKFRNDILAEYDFIEEGLNVYRNN